MRALPALSVEYLGATALGNVAPLAGVLGIDRVAAAGLVEAGATVAGAGTAVDAAAGAAASPLHCVLRKSFHFWPLSVPAF